MHILSDSQVIPHPSYLIIKITTRREWTQRLGETREKSELCVELENKSYRIYVIQLKF